MNQMMHSQLLCYSSSSTHPSGESDLCWFPLIFQWACNKNEPVFTTATKLPLITSLLWHLKLQGPHRASKRTASERGVFPMIASFVKKLPVFDALLFKNTHISAKLLTDNPMVSQ